MSESVKLCLKNVKKQDQLINNESYFYTIRETKYRDDKTKAESELQRAKLNVAQTKTEIGLAKEKIAQAERGAEEARLAVEVIYSCNMFSPHRELFHQIFFW